jgi:hypothetical protein
MGSFSSAVQPLMKKEKTKKTKKGLFISISRGATPPLSYEN